MTKLSSGFPAHVLSFSSSESSKLIVVMSSVVGILAKEGMTEGSSS